MSALYLLAGMVHFIRPSIYMKIMPRWIPWHWELIILSGICEILLAILLLFPVTRPLAAWGIIILLIAVFPANIQMMLNYLNRHHPYLWIAILRLPLQLLLIWWAYQYTK
jgi:uncharacterized membrane protein